MSIQSGDLLTPIEHINNLDTVRRIEPNQSTKEFGQKERDAKRNRKNPHHAPVPDEDPHDVVDVSSAYHVPDTDSATDDTVPGVQRPTIPVPSPPAPDHHVDIKV